MVQTACGGSMLSAVLLEGFIKLCDRVHEAIFVVHAFIYRFMTV